MCVRFGTTQSHSLCCATIMSCRFGSISVPEVLKCIEPMEKVLRATFANEDADIKHNVVDCCRFGT